MYSPNVHTDHLLAAVTRLVGAVEYALDTGSDHGHADGCCHDALDILDDANRDLPRLLSQFTHYSDGRPIVSHVDVDDGGMRCAYLWPPDADDLPAEPVDRGPYTLAPNRRPGDRGSVIVNWDPVTFTATTTMLPPLGVIR